MTRKATTVQRVSYEPPPSGMKVSATHTAGYQPNAALGGKARFDKFEFLHDPMNRASATIYDSRSPELDDMWVNIDVRTPNGESVEISLPGDFVAQIGHIVKVRQSSRARAHLRHLQE